MTYDVRYRPRESSLGKSSIESIVHRYKYRTYVQSHCSRTIVLIRHATREPGHAYTATAFHRQVIVGLGTNYDNITLLQ